MNRPGLWIAAAALYACAIFIGSAIPGPELPPLVTSISDKLLHICEYGVFGFLVYRALRMQGKFRGIARHAALAAIILAALYGASDEVHQLYVPGRSAEVLDWTADASGAILGVLSSAWLLARTRRGTRSR